MIQCSCNFALIKPIEQWPDAGQRLVALAHLIKDGGGLVILAVIVIAISLAV